MYERCYFCVSRCKVARKETHLKSSFLFAQALAWHLLRCSPWGADSLTCSVKPGGKRENCICLSSSAIKRRCLEPNPARFVPKSNDLKIKGKFMGWFIIFLHDLLTQHLIRKLEFGQGSFLFSRPQFRCYFFSNYPNSAACLFNNLLSQFIVWGACCRT